MSDRDGNQEAMWAEQRAREQYNKGMGLARRVKDIAKANGIDAQRALQRFAAESVLWALTQVQDDDFMIKGGLLWGQRTRATTDADVLFERRKTAAQLHAEIQAAAALLAEHGIRVATEAVRKLEMGGAGRGLRAPLRVYIGTSQAVTQLDVSFGKIPTSATQETYRGMFKGAPFLCHRQSWEDAAADRLGAIFQHGFENTRLKDFRDLFRLRQRGDLDDAAICRGLVRYFDDRGMDRAALLRVPDGLTPEYAYANRQAWLDRIVRDDPGLPADFLDVAEDVGDWWLSLRSTLVDLADQQRLEDRVEVAEVPTLVPGTANVFSMAAYRVARR